MSGEKLRAAAEYEKSADGTVTRLNTDITENLKSMPDATLSPRERHRLRELLEREHAQSRKRRSPIIDFLRSLWFGPR